MKTVNEISVKKSGYGSYSVTLKIEVPSETLTMNDGTVLRNETNTSIQCVSHNSLAYDNGDNVAFAIECLTFNGYTPSEFNLDKINADENL